MGESVRALTCEKVGLSDEIMRFHLQVLNMLEGSWRTFQHIFHQHRACGNVFSNGKRFVVGTGQLDFSGRHLVKLFGAICEYTGVYRAMERVLTGFVR